MTGNPGLKLGYARSYELHAHSPWIHYLRMDFLQLSRRCPRAPLLPKDDVAFFEVFTAFYSGVQGIDE